MHVSVNIKVSCTSVQRSCSPQEWNKTMLGQVWSLEFFQIGRTHTDASNKTSSASQSLSFTGSDNTFFSFSFAATIFCFSDKLKLKSSKVCFVLSALQPFKPMMKNGGLSYDNCNDWLSYEQLTNHKKSHIKRLIKVLTWKKRERKKKRGCVGCTKMQAIPFSVDGRAC